jgi:hypothetical protein
MSSLLNLVQRHLSPQDPRRLGFERLAAELGVADGVATTMMANLPSRPPGRTEQLKLVNRERMKIVSIVRGAQSVALREQLRVRSFRAVLLATAGVMFLLVVGLAVLGWVRPAALPLCFAPEEGSMLVVVCPTEHSPTVRAPAEGPTPDVDALVLQAVQPIDIVLVELLGLLAASVAAAAAIRRIRGSSEPHGLPVALAMLKLPTGALTAVLGLLLMRGGFVPGLSALDSSAQIVAWAILFGYGQQLFTRFVDQQADSILDGVRPGRTETIPATPPSKA